MKYFATILFLTLLSCNSKDEEIVTFSSEADSAIAIIESADSTYQVRHGSFSGKHMHSGDAAEASHQDIPKKRRMAKKEAEQFESKRTAYEKENERRRQEIQKQKDSAPLINEL